MADADTRQESKASEHQAVTIAHKPNRRQTQTLVKQAKQAGTRRAPEPTSRKSCKPRHQASKQNKRAPGGHERNAAHSDLETNVASVFRMSKASRSGTKNSQKNSH